MKKNQTIFLKLCLADALVKMMATQQYDEININTLCELAGVGRTTYYRHLDPKNSKEELLTFKIVYEWTRYIELHEEEYNRDKTPVLYQFVYENRKFFLLLYRNHLIAIIMRLFEHLIINGMEVDKHNSYMVSFFTYGHFGIIWQWMKYGFDETPEQVQKHLMETLFGGHQPESNSDQK